METKPSAIPTSDTDDIYVTDLDSESDNYGLPNYGGQMEFQYDDSSPMDQPRKRPQTGGRAAPISVNVEEKLGIKLNDFVYWNARAGML